MTAPHVQPNVVDRRKGYVDATVTPRPGQEAHRIGYLRGEGWWCHTCDQGTGRGKRCRLIQLVKDHPNVPDMEGSMPVLLGPADADHYRVKVGRYRDRWYVDPLPGDQIAQPTDQAWPSVSNVKGAYGKNWEYVALKRVATHLQEKPNELDGLSLDDCYDRLKQIGKSQLRVAQHRGTDVHTMFENQLRGRVTDDRMLTAEAREYRPAVDAFFDHHQPELFAAELVCINRDLHGVGYGGTADAIVRIDGKLYKVDWKSRGKSSDHEAYPEEVAQLGAYAGSQYIILDEPKRAAMPQLDAGLIVSIRPDGYRVYPIDLGEAWLQFEGLHDWWVRRLDENNAIGRPWAPRGHFDLFQAIADAEPNSAAMSALWRAHQDKWTPEATAAAKARIEAAQTAPRLVSVKTGAST